MNWCHYNPVRVKAGVGLSRCLGEYVPEGPVLLLTTAGMERRGVIAALMSHIAPKMEWTIRFVASNPDIDMLDNLASQLSGYSFSAVVALGGGSVIDAAKVISVLLMIKGDQLLHQSLRNDQVLDFTNGLPVICLPTTSGSGAEVTPFSTIWDSTNKKKYSLGNDALFPSLTILDPELTLTLPWQETLFSALDASSHALETLWNRYATPISAGLALQALQKIIKNLPLVQSNPLDIAARSQLQEASLLAGLAISQNRTALAHSISYPLTAHFGVPHGLACSFTLPALIQWVTREKAWVIPLPDKQQVDFTKQLAGYNLGQQVLGYCSQQKIMACVSEMFDPLRAGNFVLMASEDDVFCILGGSLK